MLVEGEREITRQHAIPGVDSGIWDEPVVGDSGQLGGAGGGKRECTQSSRAQ